MIIRGLIVALSLLVLAPAAIAGAPKAVIYKSPTCGCCTGWAEHLIDAGWQVEQKDVDDMVAVKEMLGVAPELSSCHTAIVEGYVVEGHVPVEVLDKMLTERPRIRGIALPGMPVGTPGMPGPKTETWTVYTIEAEPKVYWEK